MNSATAAMIDGIKDACQSWGRAMRWILSAEGEGFPTVASFERANQGDMDANSITLKQRFGEVMTKDALAVSLAMRRTPIMPEQLHRALFVHYVVPRWITDHDEEGNPQRREITTVMKARDLGYPRVQPYYTALDYGYHFLLGRIEVTMPVPRRPEEIRVQA